MNKVIDLASPTQQNPEGWWIIAVNLPDCGNKVEYRENHGVMVYAKNFRELPSLIEQGRKLLAIGASVWVSAERRCKRDR